MKRKETREEKLRIMDNIGNTLFGFVCATLLFIAMMIFGVCKWDLDYKLQNNGKEVETTFCAVYQRTNGNCCVAYEYIDENGVRYTGRAYELSYSEAKSYIGKKVKIVINGKGKSALSGDKTYNIGCAMGLFGTFELFFFSLLFLKLWQNKMNKELAKISEETKEKEPLEIGEQESTNSKEE